MEAMSCAVITMGEPVASEMEMTCPVCGLRAALIPLGTRVDRPHRWRPWVVVKTEIALCARCGAIATSEVTEAASTSSAGLWRPATLAA